MSFLNAIHDKVSLSSAQDMQLLDYGEVGNLVIHEQGLALLDDAWLTPSQIDALRGLSGQRFRYKWRLAQALAQASEEWRPRENTTLNKRYNKEIERKLSYVYRTFAQPSVSDTAQ